MDEKNLFSTRDLYLAATLVTLKFYMVGIDYQIEGEKNQPVGYFKFENSQSLQDAKRKYTQGMLSIEPKAFVMNIHSLKAEVTNVYKNPHTVIEKGAKK
jgi:hypothetical protein